MDRVIVSQKAPASSRKITLTKLGAEEAAAASMLGLKAAQIEVRKQQDPLGETEEPNFGDLDPAGKYNRRSRMLTKFPTRLHDMLDDAEKCGFEDVVSWLPDGKQFCIHTPSKMIPLLAKYFTQSKFKSFLRQLQSYDFHRHISGPDKGICSHPLIVRGNRSLILRMRRQAVLKKMEEDKKLEVATSMPANNPFSKTSLACGLNKTKMPPSMKKRIDQRMKEQIENSTSCEAVPSPAIPALNLKPASKPKVSISQFLKGNQRPGASTLELEQSAFWAQQRAAAYYQQPVAQQPRWTMPQTEMTIPMQYQLLKMRSRNVPLHPTHLLAPQGGLHPRPSADLLAPQEELLTESCSMRSHKGPLQPQMVRDRLEAADPLLALTGTAASYGGATNLHHHLLASRKAPSIGYPFSAFHPAAAASVAGVPRSDRYWASQQRAGASIPARVSVTASDIQTSADCRVIPSDEDDEDESVVEEAEPKRVESDEAEPKHALRGTIHFSSTSSKVNV